MKKIFAYLTIIALAALAAGCAKEMSQEEVLVPVTTDIDADGTFTVQFLVPDSPDTKTALGAKEGNTYPVKWSSSDPERITLNGSAPTASTKDSDTQITASFKPAAGLSVYNFLYRGDAGHDNQVTIPASQAYYANDFDDAAMPMYAASAARSATVTFGHLCSLLKFSITGEKKIDSVTLTAVDGSKSLSGTFTIGKTDTGLLNGTLTPVSGGGSINYNFGSHIQLSDTAFEFFVAIPAGTYDGGITLEIVDNASGHMTATVMDSDATKTIAAGKVREFNNIVYIPDVEQNLKQIWNAATFQEFVSAVAGGKKTLNARLTPSAASIDLSSIAGSFESIDDYKGVFDGNGKTLKGLTKPMFNDLRGVVKNLTLNSTIAETDAGKYNVGMFARQVIPSSEVDDIAGLQNCTTTSDASVNFTPSDAVSGNACIGGLVGNNKGGAITGCTNNATVRFNNNGSDSVHAMQPSIGGVVGRTQKGGDLSTQGDISNCTNAGTVVCGAKLSQGIYLGGVLGYQVEKAESISGCTNSGTVIASSTCSTTGPLHIGGVIGMGKGTIESCSNLSGGAVTTEDGCTAGTYICHGGVVGRLNREADSYSGLANAGNINAAAAGASTGAYIGGIAGRCNEGASISDCTNTGGTIEFTGEISTCELNIGGIVGNTNKPVSNCTNGTAIIAGGTYSYNSSGKYYSVGGIVGYQKSDEALTNNTNTAAITFSGNSGGYAALGGICGYANGAISGGGNTGTISFTGSSNTQNFPIGGIAARTPSGKSGDRVSGVTNSGPIVINTTTQTKKTVYVGGVVGHFQSGELNATNGSTLTVTNMTCTNLVIGGLIGQSANGASITSGSSNTASGDIAINGLNSTQQSYFGGLVGQATGSSGSITGTNAGDIILASTSSVGRSLYLGGIVGRSEEPISFCTNSGLVSNAAPMSGGGDYWMEIGGVVGYNNGNAPIDNCHNTGDVINSGNSGSYLMVGGITGESDALISNCDNTGDVTNSGNSGNSHPINIGGITGRSSAGMTYSSNGTSTANGGTISNSGTSAERLCIGGIYGYSIEDGSLSNSFNKGAVINSGDAPAANAIFVGGAIGFQHNNTDSEATSYNKGVASVITYVDNSGAVTNDAEASSDLQMGGIAAEAWGSVDHCNNSGEVKVSADVAKSLYRGGILGWIEVNASNSVHDCENTATGKILVDGGLAINGQIFCSGIIGGEKKQVEASYYNLINRAEITLDDTIDTSVSSKTYSYISGIGGGNGDTYVTYSNCENYGGIYYKGKHRARVGGVLACAWRSPDNSKCVAPVEYYCTNNSSNKSDVGGVIGYYKAQDDGTIDNILYQGYLCTNGSSPRAYTAFLVGRVNDDTVTFTDCKVGGQVKGVGTTYNTAALGCCAVSSHEINFTNLIVATGTKRHTTTITSLSLNYSSTLKVGVLCSGTTSESNSTTLENASTGTMTNCTIGSIDAYL